MRRRTAAIPAVIAVLALTLAAPAAAQDPPELGSYAAGSTSTALELTLLGQTLGVSHTTAGVVAAESEDPSAAANGAALLLAGSPVPGDAPAAAPGGEATNEACAGDLDLGELTGGALELLDLGLACVETAAAVTDGAPGASSTTGEVVLRITAPGGAALEPILAPLFDVVPQVTTPLFEALAPLFDALEDATQIDLQATLARLLADLQDTTVVLAEVVVAPAASQAAATQPDGVVARAGSQGVTIRVLPGIAGTLADLGLQVPGVTEPLLTVTLGQAHAEVVRDPLTGEATTDASAAQLLAIDGADELGILSEIFGQLTGAISDLTVDLLACADTNPLADVLCIDLGAVRQLDAEQAAAAGFDFGGGTVGVEATAAAVRLLPIAEDILGAEALGISLASATAAANAAVAGDVPPEEENPRTPGESLPKTGGGPALPLTLGLAAAAATGMALVRRTRTA